MWNRGFTFFKIKISWTETYTKIRSVLRAVDQWCDEYESRIQGLGGIGFFMGGIGLDPRPSLVIKATPIPTLRSLDLSVAGTFCQKQRYSNVMFLTYLFQNPPFTILN